MIRTLFLESTNLCNGRCLFCWHNKMKYPKGYMDIDIVKKIYEQITPRLTWFHFAGEPLINPNLPDMIAECERKSGIVTNGQLLTPHLSMNLLRAGLNRLIISVVADTPNLYYRINGLHQRTIETNINVFKKYRDAEGHNCEIDIRLIICEENQHRVKEIEEYWSGFGDLFYSIEEFNVPTLPHRNVIHKTHVNCLLKRKLNDTLCVKWDGKVVPCCNDLDGWHILGDVTKTAISDIYYGEQYNAFRRKLVSNNLPHICEYCRIKPSRNFRKFWRKFHNAAKKSYQ